MKKPVNISTVSQKSLREKGRTSVFMLIVGFLLFAGSVYLAYRYYSENSNVEEIQRFTFSLFIILLGLLFHVLCISYAYPSLKRSHIASKRYGKRGNKERLLLLDRISELLNGKILVSGGVQISEKKYVSQPSNPRLLDDFRIHWNGMTFHSRRADMREIDTDGFATVSVDMLSYQKIEGEKVCLSVATAPVQLKVEDGYKILYYDLEVCLERKEYGYRSRLYVYDDIETFLFDIFPDLTLEEFYFRLKSGRYLL